MTSAYIPILNKYLKLLKYVERYIVNLFKSVFILKIYGILSLYFLDFQTHICVEITNLSTY